jgi:tripartite-type tricarboxylate transporter receptor subunit TctC
MVPLVAMLVAAVVGLNPALGRAGEKSAYPTKPVRLIVPFAPGDSADLVARLFASPLAAHLQHAATVDNRSGKGGVTGTEVAARTKPDGYTVSIGTTVTRVIAPLAMKPW